MIHLKQQPICLQIAGLVSSLQWCNYNKVIHNKVCITARPDPLQTHQDPQSTPLFSWSIPVQQAKNLIGWELMRFWRSEESKRKTNGLRERQRERAEGRIQRGRTAFCSGIASSSLLPLERNQAIQNLIRNRKLLRKKKWKFISFPRALWMLIKPSGWYIRLLFQPFCRL